MSRRLLTAALAVGLAGSPALGAGTRATKTPAQDSTDKRLEQLGLKSLCFHEVLFEDISLTTNRELAVGIYEQRRQDPGSPEKIPIANTQEVVIFGIEPPKNTRFWKLEPPSPICDIELAEQYPVAFESCSDHSRCRKLWATTDEGKLELLEIRTELRRPTEEEAKQTVGIEDGRSYWIHGVYRQGTPNPITSRILASPFGGLEQCLEDRVFVAVADRDQDGLDWQYRPLTGLGASHVEELTGEPGCSYQVGIGGKDVRLKNDFVEVVALGNEDIDDSGGGEVLYKEFFAKDPWIFDNEASSADEHRIGANLFWHANKAIYGFSTVFPWLPEQFKDTPGGKVRLHQVIGHDKESCKARWLRKGMITIPLGCSLKDGFQPKSLCGEVVTHELVHDLASRLLEMITGGLSPMLDDELLWQAIADYLAVSLDQNLDGIYGFSCGDDLRSIRDGLYKPALKRPKSFLEQRRVDDAALKSVLLSRALFDLGGSLTRADIAKEPTLGADSEAATVLLAANRRIVDRLVILSLMLGGHDWRTFLERLIDVVKGLLPDRLGTFCETLWDRHHLIVRGCAGKTQTTMFDIVAEIGCDKANSLRVDGFAADADSCDPPRLRIRIDGEELRSVAFANGADGYRGPIEFPHTIALAAGDQHRTIEVSIEAKCPRVGPKPVVQRVKADWCSRPGGAELRTAARGELLLSSSEREGGPGLRIAARDGGGVLYAVSADLDFNSNQLVDPQVWDTGRLIEKDSWRFRSDDDSFLEASAPDGKRLVFDLTKREVENADQQGAQIVQGPATAPLVLTDPPGLLLNPGRDDEEVVTFRESTCRLPPDFEEGPDGAIAILTCDGFLGIREPGSTELEIRDLRPSRVLVSEPLTLEDVDGDGEVEIIVGPLAEGWGYDAFGELHAYEWNGERAPGRWPIRTAFRPTAQPFFFDIDGDDCLEVILASDRVDYADPNVDLQKCRPSQQ